MIWFGALALVYNHAMTYLVLARKYRPRSFDTLIGQDHVVRALTHALDTQRLHHAWLFTGTRGVGKTTLSRILAKSLNCETGITSRPCGVCQACRDIDAGRFVDYVELDAASNRGVDEMTQLLEQAVYAPSVGRFKVYMIDEVHMLTGHAFNAMLKTLEEPPAHVKFIIATTDPQKIPVTVLSRCLQFNLKQMPPDAIVGHLGQVLQEEEIPCEAPALRLIAQAAAGSMRDALSLTDQAIAYSAGSVTEEAVRGMLGTIDQRHLVRLLQALGQGQAATVIGVADELSARGLSFSGALADLSSMLSRIAIARRVPGALDASDPLAADIAALAGQLHPDTVQLFYSVAVHSRQELTLAPDEYAGFVMACLRMLALVSEAGPVEMPVLPGANAADSQSHGDHGSAAQASVGRTSAAQAAAPHPASALASVAQSAAAQPAPVRPSVAQPAAAEPAGAQPAAAPAATAQPAVAAPTAAQAAIVPAATDQPRAQESAAQQPVAQAAQKIAAVEPVKTTVVHAPAPTSAPWDDAPPTAPRSDDAPTPPRSDDVPLATASAASGPDDMPSWLSEDIPDDARSASDEAFVRAGDDDDEFETLADEPFDAAVVAGRPIAAAPAARSGKRQRLPKLSDMTAQDWPTLAAALPVSGLAAEVARQSEWLGVTEDTIRLRVAVKTLADSASRVRLQTVLCEHYGRAVRIDIAVGVTGEATAHAVAQSVRQANQLAAEQAVAEDPFVNALLADFGAHVVPNSIRHVAGAAAI